MSDQVKNVVAWVISVLLSLSFVFAGYQKIPPGTGMIKRFEAWGYTADFALLVGVLEVLAGVLVLMPRLASYGGLLIVILMSGAIFTHLSTGVGSAVFATLYLIMAVLLVLTRIKQSLFIAPHFNQ